MTTHEDRTLADQIAGKPYLDYVVDKAVETRVSAMLGRWKWYLTLALAVVAFGVGWNVFDFSRVKKDSEATTEQLKRLLAAEMARSNQVKAQQDALLSEFVPLKRDVPELSQQSKDLAQSGMQLRHSFVSISSTLTGQTDDAMHRLRDLQSNIEVVQANLDAYATREKAELDAQIAAVRQLIDGIKNDQKLLGDIGTVTPRLEALEARGANARFDVERAARDALREIDARQNEAVGALNGKTQVKELQRLREQVERLHDDVDRLKRISPGGVPAAFAPR